MSRRQTLGQLSPNSMAMRIDQSTKDKNPQKKRLTILAAPAGRMSMAPPRAGGPLIDMPRRSSLYGSKVGANGSKTVRSDTDYLKHPLFWFLGGTLSPFSLSTILQSFSRHNRPCETQLPLLTPKSRPVPLFFLKAHPLRVPSSASYSRRTPVPSTTSSTSPTASARSSATSQRTDTTTPSPPRCFRAPPRRNSPT